MKELSTFRQFLVGVVVSQVLVFLWDAAKSPTKNAAVNQMIPTAIPIVTMQSGTKT
jgi:hypothetical protein